MSESERGGAPLSGPKPGAELAPWLIDATLRNAEGLGRVEGALVGVNTRLDGVESRLDGVESRLDGVDSRLDRIDSRLDGVESRLDRFEIRIDTRFDRVEGRLDSIALELKGHGNWIHTLKVVLSGLAFIAGIVVTGVVLSWLKSRFGF